MLDDTVREALTRLVEERDWGQFHTPENLAKSVSIEAGELLECFQWDAEHDPAKVEEELADVLTYCYLLAMRLDLDPDQVVAKKLEITRQKYPAERARGVSSRYDQLPD
jgi:NTP pyrophosphatase (non-canonical NTP hydrolase)